MITNTQAMPPKGILPERALLLCSSRSNKFTTISDRLSKWAVRRRMFGSLPSMSFGTAVRECCTTSRAAKSSRGATCLRTITKASKEPKFRACVGIGR